MITNERSSFLAAPALPRDILIPLSSYDARIHLFRRISFIHFLSAFPPHLSFSFFLPFFLRSFGTRTRVSLQVQGKHKSKLKEYKTERRIFFACESTVNFMAIELFYLFFSSHYVSGKVRRDKIQDLEGD